MGGYLKLEKVKRGQLDLPGLSYQIAEHDRENHMNEITHTQAPAPAPTDSLHAELRALIASSRQRLAQEFGRGFKAKNLRRRMQSTQAFPLPGIVATLSRQLSWSKSCTQRCLKRVSGWHGAGCCWVECDWVACHDLVG